MSHRRQWLAEHTSSSLAGVHLPTALVLSTKPGRHSAHPLLSAVQRKQRGIVHAPGLAGNTDGGGGSGSTHSTQLPPQSNPVSSPFCRPSLQLGGQAGQLPPQSMLTSSPSSAAFEHEGGWGASILHSGPQTSPETRLPSSHSSAESRLPSPQAVLFDLIEH